MQASAGFFNDEYEYSSAEYEYDVDLSGIELS